MIPAITYEQIIRVLRQEIATQTGVNINDIHNSASVRGPKLSKILSDHSSTSYDLHDVFIIFELVETEDEGNVVLEENNNTMTSIFTYKMNLKIYGNYSHTISKVILMQFKSHEVASKMMRNGIIIKGISSPENANEFINNTLWVRCDMDITLVARHVVDKISPDDYGVLGNIITRKIS